VKYQLVKLKEVSGKKASIYSIKIGDDTSSIFEQFLEEYYEFFTEEIDEIASKVHKIGHRYGARNQFFKLKEGRGGDLVMALYDHPSKNLRVYGIRYATTLIILGSGGHKPKHIRSLQEDEVLLETNVLMRQVSDDILARMREKEIWFSGDDFDLHGNLKFDEEY